MNIKELLEKRNSLVANMQTLMNTVETEKRVFTDEENAQFDNLEKEIANLDNTIDRLEKANKIGLKEVIEPARVENNDVKVFENYIRGVVNADQPTTKADGQVTIPSTIAQQIITKVIDISPIFQMAQRYNVKGKLVLTLEDAENSTLKMEYADEGSTANSGKVKFKTIELEGYLGRALAKVSKSLINNSQFDIVAYVVDRMSQAIALFIEHELLIGTSTKVKGLLDVTQSVTTKKATEVTADELIDLQESIPDTFQGNAVWIMNKATRTAIRKLKDGQGNYLLNKDATAKWGYTLLGKDVYTTDAMEKMGTSKVVAFYGDMTGLAVKVSEDINMQVLKERYAEEHMDGILAFVELDAKVQNTQKIAKLVCASA